MKVRVPISGTPEAHFRIMILLMVLFYLSDICLDIITGMSIVPVKPGGTISRDAFLVLMGIAVGIFRGMMPQSQGESNGNETQTGDEGK